MGSELCKSTLVGENIEFRQPLDRVQEGHLASIYHRSIGAITFRDNQAKLGVGTGILISRNLVLTAAHIIYDKATKEEHQKATFQFYLQGAPGGKHYQIEAWRYLQEFKACPEKEEVEVGYALLKLKNCVEQRQFLELGSPCHACLSDESLQMSIYGYPIYKDNFEPTKIIDGQGQTRKIIQFGLTRRNRIIQLSKQQDFIIGYMMNAFKGQEGSPIVANDKIIGTHIIEGKHFNMGRLISRDVIEQISKWGYEMRGCSFAINEIPCPHQQFDWKRQVFSILSEAQQPQSLKIHMKGLRQIKVQKWKGLKILDVCWNQISIINLLNNSNLKLLKLSSNRIIEINLSNNNNLDYLDLSCNELAEVNLRHNINLRKVRICRNRLQEINLSRNIYLQSLELDQNRMGSIDLSFNQRISYLRLGYNQLASIDVSRLAYLQSLNARSNLLTSIQLRRNTNLEELNLSNNRLSQIDISSNVVLQKVELSFNHISSINLRNNPCLTRFEAYSNFLTSIDLSRNPYLQTLGLSFNSLSTINVSSLTLLKKLAVSVNDLTAIDLSSNPYIKCLLLQHNKLASVCIWYSPELSMRYEGQRSVNCEIVVKHHKEETQQYEKWRDDTVQRQRRLKSGNCQYSFIHCLSGHQ